MALQKNESGYSGRAALVGVEHSSRKKGSVNNRFVKKLSAKAVARQVEKIEGGCGGSGDPARTELHRHYS